MPWPIESLPEHPYRLPLTRPTSSVRPFLSDTGALESPTEPIDDASPVAVERGAPESTVGVPFSSAVSRKPALQIVQHDYELMRRFDLEALHHHACHTAYSTRLNATYNIQHAPECSIAPECNVQHRTTIAMRADAPLRPRGTASLRPCERYCPAVGLSSPAERESCGWRINKCRTLQTT